MPYTPMTADLIDPVLGKPTPTVTVPDASNGNMFAASDRVILRIANTNAATRTVTITPGTKTAGLTITPPTWIIAATTGVTYVGPFPVAPWGQATGTDAGNVYVNITASAGVTYELVRIP